MESATSYNRFSPRRLKASDAELVTSSEDIASMTAQIETNLKYAMCHGLTIVTTLGCGWQAALKLERLGKSGC